MAMYVFRTNGAAAGFLFGNLIYNLDGEPLGRVIGSRVHRIDGSYVGEWFHNMVVARPSGLPRNLHPICRPAARPAPKTPCARRPVAEYHLYPDAFENLRDRAGTSRIPAAS
ncbi:MAG: 4-fold beta flower protein [Allosphingosinicella sp.]